jgi:YcxB-like protein
MLQPMERQISYNWLPEEGLAIARDKFAEDFLNPRTLTLVVVLLYVPFVGQAYWFNPEFFMHPLFYLVLLGPVAIYALEYWRYLKSGSSPEGKWGIVGAPVTFTWDDKGFDVSCDGNGFRLDWSNFERTVETERFFKLYGHHRQAPMYVFKRPMSDAQREDFRRCASIVGSMHPAFT